ncbi:MAG: phosphodiester glycosidase family protein [Lachnospiraceae bacterium]|nr:phosphodiester glycosidase family protein [Lachnospiraceae bacterium]
MKQRLFGLIFAILLTGFTLYVVLDTFVIVRVIQVVTPTAPASTSASKAPTEAPTEKPTEAPTVVPSGSAEEPEDPTAEPTAEEPVTEEPTTEEPTTEPTTEVPTVVTENSYTDQNIQIHLSQIREHDTEIYIVDVQIASPDLLKTALAHDTYGRNVWYYTSGMAAEKGAILAINGDFYGARERGYVMRGGILFRKSSSGANQNDLVIYPDGSMEVILEGEISADALAEKGAREILSFGPALILDGQITVGERDEVAIANARNQRTAIGYYDPLHYVFVVSDGRTNESRGLSLYQLASVMQTLGVKMAYNLDGGGSSTLVFDGRIINKPTGDGKRLYERQVSDIVYIGY